MPLAWLAKRQGGSAYSTPEAETVSMATGAREEAIPLQGLVEMVLGRPVVYEIGEDNTSSIAAMREDTSQHCDICRGNSSAP